MQFPSGSLRLACLLILAGPVALWLTGCGRDSDTERFVSFARVVAQPAAAPPADAPGEAAGSSEFFETQIAWLRSGEVRRRAVERLEAKAANAGAGPVEIEVTRTRNSPILNVQAIGGEPEYTQKYLNAVLDEFINFRREMDFTMWDGNLAPITDELHRLEQELQRQEKEYRGFEKEHKMAVVKEKTASLAAILKELRQRIVELELEAKAKGVSPEEQARLLEDLASVRAQIASHESALVDGAGTLQSEAHLREEMERTRLIYEDTLRRLREIDVENHSVKPTVTVMERATGAVLLEPEGFLKRIFSR